MEQYIIERLTRFTDEELGILHGRNVEKNNYTDSERFVINGAKLLEGAQIDLRPHTRFIDFPEHKHDNMEFI